MTIRRVACLPLALAIVVGCDAPAGGRWPRQGVGDQGDANPPATVVTAGDLRLLASVERETYLVGEPVYLILRLENTGRQARLVFGSLDPSDGAVEIVVSGRDTREQRFVPLVEADHDDSIMVELVPGRPLGVVAPVFFGANGWTFPAPGAYSLTATYRTSAGDAQSMEVRSAAVNIEVRASGDGSGEFLVGQSTASIEAGKFLTWQAGDHLAAGREHLENLLRRYPRSELTHYVRSAFSRSYATRFMDYRTRQVRPPNCEIALEHLRTVVDGRLPGYVRMQNALTRARCAARAGNGAAARDAIREAREIARELPEYRGIITQMEELERNLGRPR